MKTYIDLEDLFIFLDYRCGKSILNWLLSSIYCALYFWYVPFTYEFFDSEHARSSQLNSEYKFLLAIRSSPQLFSLPQWPSLKIICFEPPPYILRRFQIFPFVKPVLRDVFQRARKTSFRLISSNLFYSRVLVRCFGTQWNFGAL